MARVHGIAIAPGVSRNGRLYTRENLAAAHKRLSARIAEGVRPVIMRTHHDAGDDSLRIAARVNAVSLTSDGAIAYEGTTVETAAGRDIAALVNESDTEPTPVLAHVSIHGNWVGEHRKVIHNGQLVETGDDLEIDKIDFTATPGVLSATVRSESFTPSTDPGVISETLRPVQLFSDALGESYGMEAEPRATVSMSAYVGGYDLSICAWGVPPEDLDACADTARAAITAALAALAGPAAAETHTSATPVAENTKEAPMGNEAAATPAAETAAPEAATQVEETTEPTLGDVLNAIKTLTVVLTPPVAAETATTSTETVAETATETGETAPADAALRESIKNEILGELVTAGVVKPSRKGFGLAETTEAKTEVADAWENRGDNLAAAFGATPAAVGLADEA